jgi:hypothetical protein
VEYKNGQKNNWRSCAWNALASAWRSVIIPPYEDKVVLYLPGEKDLERQVAMRKGVKSWDLIGVERDYDIVKKLRKQGAIVIHGDLEDVLRNWVSDKVNVGVISADLQCGFNSYVTQILDTLATSPTFTDFALLINLQRGRDERIVTQEDIEKFKKVNKVNLDDTSRFYDIAMYWGAATRKERDRQILYLEMWMEEFEETGPDLPWEEFNRRGKYLEYLTKRIKVAQGVRALQSYRSNFVKMDSLVLQYLVLPLSNERSRVYERNEETEYKIRAALAVRTMRKNGIPMGRPRGTTVTG